MNTQAFAALEYESLRTLIRRGAQTAMGRALADALAPVDNFDAARRALRAVTECVRLRRRGGGWSFTDFTDVSAALARLKIEGAALDPAALLDLARLCEQVAAARAAIQTEREECLVLWERVAALPRELADLGARVFRKILPSGEIDDRASPELQRTRAEITRLRSSITRQLENLMRRQEETVQDQIVTVRNDRFVIPLRANVRGRVAGVAHGFSSSGATVFVEPLETIEANNELQSLREEEEREVARILTTLTEELRAELPAIEMAVGTMAELDLIRAKANLSERIDCIEPEIVESDELELEDARHPLLDERLRAEGAAGAVPVSFALDSERRVMIISGANAGGKTVVLKTAGLLALAALSGIHVPARRARIPFYSIVLADIGDHQSLAANLSTFTAHVTNISRMIELCGASFGRKLVLLDEVGTGTDPEEGSALGVAVVDYFRRACGAHVVATTHYSGLKIYAVNDASVVNASVEFDERTLAPTYRLLVGVAGASSGIEIARRFGFPETVINVATANVSDAAREAAEYLQRIKRESEEAGNLRVALEEERRAVAEKYAALDVEAAQRERERISQFEREMREQIAEFERRSGELVSKIEDRAERARVERERERRTAELRREAQARAAQSARATPPAAQRPDAPAPRIVRRKDRLDTEDSPSDAYQISHETRAIEKGDRVQLSSFGQKTIGIVERVSGDEAEVQVGAMRLREKVGNLKLVERVAQKEPRERDAAEILRRAASVKQRSTEIRLHSSGDDANTELNIIGRTTDEAVDAADKFLDEAYLQSLGMVRIIHGHGTGALRRAIADFLKNHPHVARFNQAAPEQGGAGATVVELKR
jgi:DNA mismatch repair protein MutS2